MIKEVLKKSNGIVNLYTKIDRQKRMLLSSISPKLASKLLFKKAFGKNLDLNNPITFNEKLMWLKLNTYYKNPLITMCADKLKVREYIDSCGCTEILNDLIDSWDSVDEIDWSSLPNKFVLKCNHGCGYNIICENKEKFDIEAAKEKLKKWIKEDYWKFYAEVNYKYIKKKIICEKYIETEDGLLPNDYKMYCFNGKPEFVMVCIERENGHPKYYFFNEEWNLIRCNKNGREAPEGFTLPKPDAIDKMFQYARLLSKPFPFVRTDFYSQEGITIFGELTFTSSGALDSNLPADTDLEFGKKIKLPEKS